MKHRIKLDILFHIFLILGIILLIPGVIICGITGGKYDPQWAADKLMDQFYKIVDWSQK
jgi:hypothetical protein